MTGHNAIARLGSLAHSRTLRVEPLEERRLLVLTAVLVSDIRTGETGSDPAGLVAVNESVYFVADDGTHGRELWKSDGTVAGAALVKDIRAGSGNGLYFPPVAHTFAAIDGTLFFSANDGTTGGELWKSDGTEAGTVRIKDIVPGESGAYPRFLTNVNGTLFFIVQPVAGGNELWRSDGTAAGTVRVKTFAAGEPRSLTNVNGTLFFVAGGRAFGSELWKSDGTTVGTVPVKDLLPSEGAYPQELTNVDGTLYFTDYHSTFGRELWKSDGSALGTVQVKDIRQGQASSYPLYLTSMGGALYFHGYDGTRGHLWKSDGTESGTFPVSELQVNRGGWELTSIDEALYFFAFDNTTGHELWTSDGTASGTMLVKDIFPGPYQCITYDEYHGVCTYERGSSTPQSLANVNGTLYFTADDGVHGRELWKVVDEDEATPGDTDADGDVDLEDLNNVRNHFGAVGGGVLGDTAPFDGDVDLDDLNAVRNHFGVVGGASAGRASSSYRVTPSPDGGPWRVAPSGSSAVAGLSPSDARQIASHAADVVFGVFASNVSPKLTQKPPARRHIAR